MNKINIFLLLLLLTVTADITLGQTKKAFISEAEKAFASQNYHGALVYYEQALKFDKKNQDLVYKTAEAARMYNAYGYALGKYQYLVDTIGNDTHTDAGYRLAEMYHRLGRYDEAVKYYQQYLSEYSNQDQKLTQAARKNINACNQAKVLSAQADPNVQVTRLGDDINSPDADFAASDRDGNMYFSSLRFESDSKKLRNKQVARTLVKSGDETPQVLPWTINKEDLSVANFAFNPQGTKVYYSICDYVNGWTQACKIYTSDVDKNGQFSNATLLDSNINAGASNTQPCPGKDLATGAEVLYFVSDRQGGRGGRDIWYSVMNGGTYGPAINLSSVNTEGDEITPFYNFSNNMLYFSTDGRDGFGGLDIFRMSEQDKTPVLLPAPFNTSMNDMYFYMDSDTGKGYLTSNRAGAAYQYESYEACCMDIYKVDIDMEMILDVTTFVEGADIPLNGTTVCLYDDETGAEISCITNGASENVERFKLLPGKKYRLTATKDGYTMATERFTTREAGNISKKLYLSPSKLRLEVLTFEQPTKQQLIGTTVTLTDLTDGTVKKVTITNDTGHDFAFDLIAGHNYILTAEKPGYSPSSATISTAGKTGIIRQDMFLQKVVLQDLLPISLYFDNDYPDPRSKQPTTSSRYVSLAENYLSRKQEYVEKFTGPLQGPSKTEAAQEIESFFEQDVRDGKDRFVAFIEQLVHRMESGEKIELEVRGFASPRSKSDYNKTLSERRVHSIRNEIRSWNGGRLARYIDNGTLKLKDVSFGDTSAKANVVKDLNDERNSIYNINAARERRVEIIKVNYN